MRRDYLLAVMLVMLIALMIIPLPNILVDTLIGLNITLSVLLLMVAIYLKSPADFSTFPTIILFGTAFRLALSIATTRLILTEANGGQIINTFGQFVISGNIIVGLVIFLIITIVQFVVITKGSERVAEVAARFCLDAMPGKQMSIDIQVRSGAISEEQGIAKRNKLDKDNQFFGAMDGAMKFVKGDAMAGLIITAINLIGGISVGMIIHGFSLEHSMSVFSLLTIGDGLVAQIPALFMSLCAATLVTRVTDADSKDLGTEIFNQLGKFRRALLIAGTVVLGFALIPGFPWHVFLLFSIVLYTSAYFVPNQPDEVVAAGSASVAQNLITTDKEDTPAKVSTQTTETSQPENIQKQEPVNVSQMRISERLVLNLGKRLMNSAIQDNAIAFRDNLFQLWIKRSGIEFPVFDIQVDEKLKGNSMRLDFDGVPAFSYDLPADYSFVAGSADFLPVFPEGSRETDAEWIGQKGIWLPDNAFETESELTKLRIPVSHVIVEAAFRITEQFAGSLFSRVELGYFLRGVEARDKDLVNTLIEELTIPRLHNILRKLVEDGVPLFPPRVVMETLYQWVSKSDDEDLLVEAIRASVHRQISHSLADDKGVIAIILLSEEVENQIRSHSVNIQDPVDQGIIFPPQLSEQVLNQFYTVTTTKPDRNRRIAVVTSSDIRRIVRNFLVSHNIHYPVISYQEISHEVQPQPIAMVRLTSDTKVSNQAA